MTKELSDKIIDNIPVSIGSDLQSQIDYLYSAPQIVNLSPTQLKEKRLTKSKVAALMRDLQRGWSEYGLDLSHKLDTILEYPEYVKPNLTYGYSSQSFINYLAGIRGMPLRYIKEFEKLGGVLSVSNNHNLSKNVSDYERYNDTALLGSLFVCNFEIYEYISNKNNKNFLTEPGFLNTVLAYGPRSFEIFDYLFSAVNLPIIASCMQKSHFDVGNVGIAMRGLDQGTQEYTVGDINKYKNILDTMYRLIEPLSDTAKNNFVKYLIPYLFKYSDSKYISKLSFLSFISSDLVKSSSDLDKYAKMLILNEVENKYYPVPGEKIAAIKTISEMDGPFLLYYFITTGSTDLLNVIYNTGVFKDMFESFKKNSHSARNMANISYNMGYGDMGDFRHAKNFDFSLIMNTENNPLAQELSLLTLRDSDNYQLLSYFLGDGLAINKKAVFNQILRNHSELFDIKDTSDKSPLDYAMAQIANLSEYNPQREELLSAFEKKIVKTAKPLKEIKKKKGFTRARI